MWNGDGEIAAVTPRRCPGALRGRAGGLHPVLWGYERVGYATARPVAVVVSWWSDHSRVHCLELHRMGANKVAEEVSKGGGGFDMRERGYGAAPSRQINEHAETF